MMIVVGEDPRVGAFRGLIVQAEESHFFSSQLGLIVSVCAPRKIVQRRRKERRIVVHLLLSSQGVIVNGGLFTKRL